MKKYKMFYQAAALVLAAVLATGMLSSCTVKDSGILMAFDGTDTGKNADIGIYGTATFADLITSQVCAVAPENAKMEDENISSN